MRKLTRIFALILVPPALLATAYLATASAAPTMTGPDHQPLQVYGQSSWPLQEAVDYWNDLAGREVVHYAGIRPSVTAANDPHTVVVLIDELTTTSGETIGRPGQTPQAITIDGRAMFQWDVYARQLGEALDFYRTHRL
jgi:hypothetical protein